MRNSITAGRRLAGQVLAAQVGMTLFSGLAFWWLRGAQSGLAAGFGGVVAIVPTMYVAFTVFVRGARASGRQALGMFYRAQAGKWVLTAFLFVLGALWFGNNFAPLILTCMGCLAVYWLMLAITGSN